ncbi:hypothetical protein [Bacillus sp. Y1]|nr:hypothetical protein [Bacillus sp. Y1]
MEKLRKITLLILLTFLMNGIIACSNQNAQSIDENENIDTSKQQDDKVSEKNDVREMVWDQLSTEQKEWVDGNWKDGKVSKIILNENMISPVYDKSYEGKEVFLIDFPTKSKSKPNNIVVYADVNTFDYIGNCLVE